MFGRIKFSLIKNRVKSKNFIKDKKCQKNGHFFEFFLQVCYHRDIVFNQSTMKVAQKEFTMEEGWKDITTQDIDPTLFQLVLAFGKDTLITNPSVFAQLKAFYPNAQIVLWSDNGQILNTRVTTDSVWVSAIYFEKTTVECQSDIVVRTESFEAGKTLAGRLSKEGLCHVLVVSEGLDINGSALIAWIRDVIGKDVTLSGWLAADNMLFKKTFVGYNAAPIDERRVVLIWFYGENLKVGLGSIGGWDKFWPQRTVTKSDGSTVYEIDGQPALDLYKTYLWEFAKDLPGSGLLFPLSVQTEQGITLVRTLLSIDEEKKSITYAWDVTEWSIAWLMKANFDKIIEGAGQSVKSGIDSIRSADFAFLISCAGRKAILKQRVEEEVENARYALGDETVIGWFYSYGEIGPLWDIHSCYLHNQTMTVTLFKEIL